MKVVVIGYVCLAEARASNSKLASLPFADRRSDQLPCRMHPATGNNTYPRIITALTDSHSFERLCTESKKSPSLNCGSVRSLQTSRTSINPLLPSSRCPYLKMSDQFKEIADIPKDFLRDGTQFLNRCTKRMC